MTETKTGNKELDKCLFLLAEKGKWIQEHLKPLKPIYNGAGWFIEEKYRSQVEQISQQADMHLIEWPLNGETFVILQPFCRHKEHRICCFSYSISNISGDWYPKVE